MPQRGKEDSLGLSNLNSDFWFSCVLCTVHCALCTFNRVLFIRIILFIVFGIYTKEKCYCEEQKQKMGIADGGRRIGYRILGRAAGRMGGPG